MMHNRTDFNATSKAPLSNLDAIKCWYEHKESLKLRLYSSAYMLTLRVNTLCTEQSKRQTILLYKQSEYERRHPVFVTSNPSRNPVPRARLFSHVFSFISTLTLSALARDIVQNMIRKHNVHPLIIAYRLLNAVWMLLGIEFRRNHASSRSTNSYSAFRSRLQSEMMRLLRSCLRGLAPERSKRP